MPGRKNRKSRERKTDLDRHALPGHPPDALLQRNPAGTEDHLPEPGRPPGSQRDARDPCPQVAQIKDIVRREPNCGYYVKEISQREIREIYDARLLLEGSLLADTANLSSTPCLDQVTQAIDAYGEAFREANDYGRMLSYMQFHLAVAALSRQRIKLKMLQDLFDLLLLKYSRNLVVTSMIDRSRRDHWRIYHYLDAGHCLEARRVLTDHLVKVRNHIVSNLTRMSGRKGKLLPEMDLFWD